MDASPNFHSLCGEPPVTKCDIGGVETDKNAGPNCLQEWRQFRKLTQEQLAERVGTNANMIGYLENGERKLTASWLRRLAPVLGTTPGMLLDYPPSKFEDDIIDIFVHASERERRRISDVIRALVKAEADD